VAKPRVTRRTHVKKPWYERPVLLFVVLAVVLIVAGIFISRFFMGRRQASIALGAEADSAAARAAAGTAEPVAVDLTGLIAVGAALPAAAPGAILPPIYAATLPEGAEARRELRSAREAEGGYAFVEGARLIEAATTGMPAWEALPLRDSQRAFCDFEVQRETGGAGYLIGFVDLDAAKALASLGPSLALPPAAPAAPSWQVWKKKGAGRLELRVGSEILLYPDVAPEASCAIGLPLERVRPLRLRRVEGGLANPVEALEVALR